MHVSSGRSIYGLSLALLTALLWGILPIKLKEVLKVMDPLTVTWYRLVVAGSLLLLWLGASGRLPKFAPLGRSGIGLLCLAVLGLAGNYVLYLLGLERLTAGTTQLVIQLAPLLFLLASLWLFREPFGRWQALGLLITVLGFGLFFNQRLSELFGAMTTYSRGIFLVVAASFVWTFYGLAQKQLLVHWKSTQVMMVIYLGCALLLAPWVSPRQLFELNTLQLWLLLACCLNTLVAYGAFAEALAHWEASRVSATLSLTPLVTFVCVELASTLWPQAVTAEQVNLIGYAGALLVVAGSALTALGRRTKVA